MAGLDQKAVADDGFIPDEPNPVATAAAKLNPDFQPDPDGFVPDRPVKPLPDMGPMKEFFKESLAKAKPAEGSQAVEAKSYMDDIQAGWQMSVTGLAMRKGMPDKILPEHADTAANILSGISQFVGDLPAAFPGMIAGGVAGSEVPVVGTVAGASAGASAAPAAVRKILMDHYQKGDIMDAQDFLERASSTLWETIKEGTVGLIAGKAGQLVKPLASKATGIVAQAVAPAVDEAVTEAISKGVASPIAPVIGAKVSRYAAMAAEVGAMATANAAFKGELPDAKDFTNAGLLMGTIHALTHVAGGGTSAVAAKARQVFGETGIKPEALADEARTNPVVAQEMLMDNGEIPSKYKPLVEVGPKEETVPARTAGETGAVGPDVSPLKNEPVRSEAAQKIRDQIQEQQKPDKGSYSVDKAYADFVDKFDPIKKAQEALQDPKAEGPIPADKNPYMLARMANDAPAKVKHILENGTLDFNTLEKTGKGLKEILSPHEGDMSGLEEYLTARRVVELEKRGIEHGFDAEAANKVMREGKSKYFDTAQELYQFKDRNLKYFRDSGLLSESGFNKILAENKAHVPFRRVFDEITQGEGRGGSPIKKIKGSEKAIQSPLLSIMEDTEAMVRLAEKNRAVDSFVKLAEEHPELSMIEKVGSKKPSVLSSEDISNVLDEKKANKGNVVGEFEVFRNGERQTYKTTPELADAFNALGGDRTAMNFFMRMAAGVTSVKKIGITSTPEFAVKNLFRDQFTASVFSKGNKVPFMSVVSALGDLMNHSETYWNWMKSGGAGGSFIDLNENYLKNDILKLNQETGVLDSVWNQMKRGKDQLLAASQMLEHATRLAEFKQVSQNQTKGAKVFEGGMAAREVTLDFSRIGAKTSAWNAITAFMNPAVQGVDKMARAIKENPGKFAATGVAYIMAPTVALWFANRNDERYKNIANWEKDRFWHLPIDYWVDAVPEDHADVLAGTAPYMVRQQNGKVQINKGPILRLPMPQEVGLLFGAAPRRLLDQFFTDNPHAEKGFMSTVMDMIKPNYVPDIVQPFVEHWANKSLFTGNELIPGHLEKVAPQYQYREYTSETAKALANLTVHLVGDEAGMVIPPAVLDNYVQSWSGALGKYALQISDAALRKAGVAENQNPPDWNISDWPVIKAFVTRYPSAGAQPLQDFRERYDAIQTRINTKNLLKKDPNRVDQFVEYLNAHGDEMTQLKGTHDALTNAMKLIHNINSDPTMDPYEKRQLIDTQYHYMIQAANMGNKLGEALEKGAEEARKKRATEAQAAQAKPAGRSPQSLDKPVMADDQAAEEDAFDVSTDQGVEDFANGSRNFQFDELANKEHSPEDKKTMATIIVNDMKPEELRSLARVQYDLLEQHAPEALREAFTPKPESSTSGKPGALPGELKTHKPTQADKKLMKMNPESWGGLVK